MVDVVSIAIAVVSLVGALLAAGVTGWLNLYSDERRRLTEAEKLVAKYRDPLLLASHDLQSRLYNIVDQELLGQLLFAKGEQKANIVLYTAFLVGQYMSWTYILRRKAQFLCFSTDKDNRDLAKCLGLISNAFSTDSGGAESAPLMLWRGQQLALGEVMTVKDDDELYCMGYAAFSQKWAHDESFRYWFQSLEHGLLELARSRSHEAAAAAVAVVVPDYRLRRLHHLLVDLIHVLDPKGLRANVSRSISTCRPAPNCRCEKCSTAPSPRPKSSRKREHV